ncbi:MAG: DUF3343 domain-containing protein [Oscillospiraceae bacterium]|nr:DUF3343 domain-containing protein [Oscillospiraceae bacterium]
MDKVNFKFNSITYAIKAKNTAERLGCKTRLFKNPNPKKGEGCGYNLIVTGKFSEVKKAFDDSKIKYTEIEMLK